MQEHHTRDHTDDDESYTCPACGASYGDIDSLLSHIAYSH